MLCLSIFGSEKAYGNSWPGSCLQALVITNLRHYLDSKLPLSYALSLVLWFLWGFWPYNVWSSADICLWFFVVNYTTMILYEYLNPQSLKL